jgi:hypothetical protein
VGFESASRGYEAQSGLRATNQNIENNPMQSSLLVAGHARAVENLLTRRANHLQYSIVSRP